MTSACPADIVEVLARADDASDVAGAARLFTHGDTGNETDLTDLLGWYDDCRKGIEPVLERPQ